MLTETCVGDLRMVGQAVAAMAYGTQTCPKVSKIFGPGNQFVTAAKMLLQNSEAMVGIDMPAGPSEVRQSSSSSTLPAPTPMSESMSEVSRVELAAWSAADGVTASTIVRSRSRALRARANS